MAWKPLTGSSEVAKLGKNWFLPALLIPTQCDTRFSSRWHQKDLSCGLQPWIQLLDYCIDFSLWMLMAPVSHVGVLHFFPFHFLQGYKSGASYPSSAFMFAVLWVTPPEIQVFLSQTWPHQGGHGFPSDISNLALPSSAVTFSLPSH